jgi:hypothetical protein
MTGDSVDPQRQPSKEDVLESKTPEPEPETEKTEPVKEESPTAPQVKSAEEPVDLPSAVSHKVDDVAESLSATADGKRASDGD